MAKKTANPVIGERTEAEILTELTAANNALLEANKQNEVLFKENKSLFAAHQKTLAEVAELTAANAALTSDKEELVRRYVEGSGDDVVQELTAQLKDANATISRLQKANSDKVVCVEGSIELNWKDPSGRSQGGKFRYLDGITKTRLRNGQLVSSTGLIRIANGGNPTADELAEFPAMNGLTKDVAYSTLLHYAKIRVGFLQLQVEI